MTGECLPTVAAGFRSCGGRTRHDRNPAATTWKSRDMPTEQALGSIGQYNRQRAELLARLVLTRRKENTVYKPGEDSGIGVDLFVKCSEPIGRTKAIPSFGVDLYGTSKLLPATSEASLLARTKFKDWRG